MTFAAPWALLGLLAIPALVAAYRVVRARRAQQRAALSALGLPPRTRLVPALLLAGLALLVVAAARPHATVTDLRREGTLVLAFDTSSSMSAKDVEPTRLEAAKRAAKDLVGQAPASVQIGVVAFGDSGVILQLPTTQRADVVAAIDRLVPQGGTSLGQGIFTAVKAAAGGTLDLPESALTGNLDDLELGYVGAAQVLLLSDGEDTSRLDPVALAELAASAGVRVDTVGIGDPRGTTVQIDGFSAATRLDEQALTEIAQRTGGVYRAAPDAATLAEVYGSIDLRLTAEPAPAEVSALAAALALALLAIGAGVSVVRTGRLL